MPKSAYLIMAAFVLWTASAWCDEKLDLLDAIEKDISEITDMATSTKYNVDYKPYIISVLTHDELRKLGIKNIREALKLVPGVDMAVGLMGKHYPVFRGSNPFSVGQSKLYIDGVEFKDTIAMGYADYLNIPVELVSRIEVVRGPGSLLSHANAYSGSINVITFSADGAKAKAINLFAGGNDEEKVAGMAVAHTVGRWDIAADLFCRDINRHLLDGPDRLGDSGEVSFDEENYALAFHANRDGLKISGRLMRNELGPSYGQSFTISEDLSDYMKTDTRNLNVGYTEELAADTAVTVSAEYYDLHRRMKNKSLPDDTNVTVGAVTMTFPYGRYFFVDMLEYRSTGRMEVRNTAFDKHALTAGVQISRYGVKYDDAMLTLPGSAALQSFELLVTAGRSITTLYAEDVYSLSGGTTVSAGFKYDTVSDHENRFSPRLAVVHMFDTHNIIKYMYTRSYRLPSWREQYLATSSYLVSNPALQPEKVDAFELSYIYKFGLDASLRGNLFWLKNRDKIELDMSSRMFHNTAGSDIKGGELELSTSLGHSDVIKGNYTFVRSRNRQNSGGDFAPRHMAVLSNIYYFSSVLTTGTTLKYVGKKERCPADSRDEVSDYLTWDQSLVYDNRKNGYMVSLTGKNLLDEDVYFPSMINTYPNDFKQPGRSFWVKLEKSF